MSLITVDRLARTLWSAADLLRGTHEPSGRLAAISLMLVIKWASDQPGTLIVPESAHWSRIVQSANQNPRSVLDVARRELQRSNVDQLGDILEGIDVPRRLGSADLAALIRYFDDDVRLDPDQLEFDDAVGQAYDQVLSWSAERAGKMGGEFHTPRSVGELMVRLTDPRQGQSVYDPFVGSGGMLLQARQYVNEQGGAGATSPLFGQEINRMTYSIGRLNLLLHGVADPSLILGDTLTDPLHIAADRNLLSFDRVLTNPPMAMSYVDSEVRLRYPERMKYGTTRGQGHKADLMNLQHVLAVLQPDGVGAMVAPHGVLFRGGVESGIRQGIIEDGRLEAVIGIGPNVFYGTAIPACILVVRGSDGPRKKRRGEVLFINAEREIATGRTQNRLEPQNVQKIVRVFESWSTVPGFSRPVSLREIADNGFNLNVGRYVEGMPSSRPQLDVRAAMFGGVPRGEVEAEASRFRAFGVDIFDLFQPKGPGYLDFLGEGHRATAARIPNMTAPRERELEVSCRTVWEDLAVEVAGLAGTRRLLMSRHHLMTSFCERLRPLDILDEDELTGTFASWWSDLRNDFRSLDQHGFRRITARWVSTGNGGPPLAPSANQEVLSAIGAELLLRVDKLVSAKRQELVKTFLHWGDRYAVSLADLEKERQATSVRLKSRLREMGLD